jgi:phosphatidate cytidylyltransferase
MLRTRVLTAVLLAPIPLAAAYFGEPWLSIVLAVVGFFALAELIALLDAAGFAPPQVLALAAGLATICAGLVAANSGNVGGLLSALISATQPPGLVAVVFAGSVVLMAFSGFTRSEPKQGFLTWTGSSFAIAYVGLLLPFIALVAQLGPGSGSGQTAIGWLGVRSGTAWLLMLILVVWGYDIGAYLTGRWLGRRRLIDHISPSKTVEGLAGGLIVATLAAGIGAGLTGLAPWHPLLIGPVVGLAAQAGDLGESMLKRAAGRKESGFLVPGHGGILDRIDSFLFAGPVLFGYALLVARVAP